MSARVTPSSLRAKKGRGHKITMLTAYDFPMAAFIEQAGADIVLVSDAVGTVGNGRGEAVSVSVDEMIYHTRAVRNGAKRCMVVTTMPFASYNTTEDALRTATRLMKEGGADAVHLEGTRREAHLIGEITAVGIPVMGHVGVTKQKIVSAGRIKLPAVDARGAQEIIGDALEMARQGAFALVLECLPAALGTIITQSLDIPTIGIGSGSDCDGQALVTQDMLGLFKELSPRFLKVYADLAQTIVGALGAFRQEVESGAFPTPQHTYAIDDAELAKLLAQLQSR
ncbi:MAG TPA: 3-methyl-2-oxobutanoate hydroxymethyltransferase [Anaerolineae bacterium]|nr:3-methyl-2-oxobutanoate hydroxymethyltransferase [Anaerolineae bacterium]HOQ97955.1 3-methyl-2-oxobutanoate hydroxymethyltransferase [Anaerolineae bacterium]HPL28938.1 3-methyl-2-oxobutanoate hydroxymethyltransferase [Anaerolineae bacterium]